MGLEITRDAKESVYVTLSLRAEFAVLQCTLQIYAGCVQIASEFISGIRAGLVLLLRTRRFN